MNVESVTMKLVRINRGTIRCVALFVLDRRDRQDIWRKVRTVEPGRGNEEAPQWMLEAVLREDGSEVWYRPATPQPDNGDPGCTLREDWCVVPMTETNPSCGVMASPFRTWLTRELEGTIKAIGKLIDTYNVMLSGALDPEQFLEDHPPYDELAFWAKP